MNMGDEARAGLQNAADKLQEAQRLLARARLIVEEATGEVLAYDIGAGSRNHHIKSAGRILPMSRDGIQSVQEQLMQVRSELLQFLGWFGRP